MFELQSKRLRLIPLTLDQLYLLAQGRKFLERSLGLSLSQLELSADQSFLEEFDFVVNNQIIPHLLKHDQKEYEWFTHWLIVYTDLNLTIGGIGLGGPPDSTGTTMLGYFIDRKSENQGIATEAVSCLLTWAFQNPALKSVVADTPVDHLASQKVLKKTGFVYLESVEEGWRWIHHRRAKNH